MTQDTNHTFFFIRHGESKWNQKALCQGTTDIDLSKKGIKDAKELSEKIADFPIECICSSPLLRALNTAKILHYAHPQADIHIIDELKERYFGDLQGLSNKKMYEIEALEEADPSYRPGLNIESKPELRKRIAKGLELAFQRHPSPVLVSHGMLFRALCDILNIPPIVQIPNLALIKFSKENDQWKSEALNF